MAANAAKPVHQMSGRKAGCSVHTVHLVARSKPERSCTHGLRRPNEQGHCRSEKNKLSHDIASFAQTNPLIKRLDRAMVPCAHLFVNFEEN
jgi:hypothetical protein